MDYLYESEDSITMTIYSIIMIAITLAYISAKLLNVVSYLFRYKDKILSQRPDPYIINQFGLHIFKNVAKAGLFTLGIVLLDSSIATENWPVVFLLVCTYAMVVPMDFMC